VGHSGPPVIVGYQLAGFVLTGMTSLVFVTGHTVGDNVSHRTRNL
jgi:hypothetical protein